MNSNEPRSLLPLAISAVVIGALLLAVVAYCWLGYVENLVQLRQIQEAVVAAEEIG